MPNLSSDSDTTCPNPHCQGGRVDTTPEGARHPAMQSDTECPVCSGTGAAPCPHPAWVRIDGVERYCASCGVDHDEADGGDA